MDFLKDEFVSFITEMDLLASKEDTPCWFDAKQETCHLLGIALDAIEKKPSKPIFFLNVAANYSDEPSFAGVFRARAEKMMRDIFSKYSVGTTFEYQLCSVKDYFGSKLWLD